MPSTVTADRFQIVCIHDHDVHLRHTKREPNHMVMLCKVVEEGHLYSLYMYHTYHDYVIFYPRLVVPIPSALYHSARI